MINTKSISIIVPGLNEAGNIGKAVAVIIDALKKQKIEDYEILMINDGSSDGTDKIIDKLAVENEKLKAFHNSKPRGVGYDFRMGVSLASKNYVGWFAGDNETLPETMTAIFEKLGEVDAIISYTVNPWVRPLYRRILSVVYTAIFNILFGLHLKYFNGACFFKREALKSVIMSADSPAFMAEIIIQVIKNGFSYIEVPMYIKVRDYGKASVLKWKNVCLIGKTIFSTLFRVYFQNKKQQ